MAGIGFELKKLFVARGAGAKLRAYAYASIVSGGTMFLALMLLICVQWLTKAYGIAHHDSELLNILMVYAMGGSLLLTAGVQMLLSRFMADQIYQKEPERLLPSLFGGAIALMVPGAIIYGSFLAGIHEVSVLDRALSLAFFMEMILLWLQMLYITAVHDYKQIVVGFFCGVATALALAWLFLWLGMSIITAVMMALVIGYGVMVILYTRVVLKFFPAGKGSLFYFIGWLGKYPELIFIGIFSQIGAYLHLIIMWFSPLGEVVYDAFRHAPSHDAAAFYAFLVTLPTNINFVVSVEVHFYDKYRRYFGHITQGGTLGEIKLSRDDMVAQLKLEIFKLLQVQVFAVILYAVCMRYFLERLGFTRDMISMFQMMCVGYSAYAVGNSVVLLHLYFDDRRSALITTATFFALNLILSLYTRTASPNYYDIGLVISGAVMYIVGLICLLYYIKDVDYHVFCEQPLLASNDKTRIERLAGKLDERALKRAQEPRRRTGRTHREAKEVAS